MSILWRWSSFLKNEYGNSLVVATLLPQCSPFLKKIFVFQLRRRTLRRSSFKFFFFFTLCAQPKKKVRKAAAPWSAELVSHSSPSTSTAHARSERFVCRGEVWFETLGPQTARLSGSFCGSEERGRWPLHAGRFSRISSQEL